MAGMRMVVYSKKEAGEWWAGLWWLGSPVLSAGVELAQTGAIKRARVRGRRADALVAGTHASPPHHARAILHFLLFVPFIVTEGEALCRHYILTLVNHCVCYVA